MKYFLKSTKALPAALRFDSCTEDKIESGSVARGFFEAHYSLQSVNGLLSLFEFFADVCGDIL